MKTIKTAYKDKISKEFSYPLGAEVISKAFKGVWQYDKLKLSFNDRSEFWASEFNKTIREKGEIKIFRIEYTDRKPGFYASRVMIESGLYSEHWSITVYAVPRKMKFFVKNALTENILPEARKWFDKIATEGYSFFEVFFNIGKETFRINTKI